MLCRFGQSGTEVQKGQGHAGSRTPEGGLRPASPCPDPAPLPSCPVLIQRWGHRNTAAPAGPRSGQSLTGVYRSHSGWDLREPFTHHWGKGLSKSQGCLKSHSNEGPEPRLPGSHPLCPLPYGMIASSQKLPVSAAFLGAHPISSFLSSGRVLFWLKLSLWRTAWVWNSGHPVPEPSSPPASTSPAVLQATSREARPEPPPGPLPAPDHCQSKTKSTGEDHD